MLANIEVVHHSEVVCRHNAHKATALLDAPHQRSVGRGHHGVELAHVHESRDEVRERRMLGRLIVVVVGIVVVVVVVAAGCIAHVDLATIDATRTEPVQDGVDHALPEIFRVRQRCTLLCGRRTRFGFVAKALKAEHQLDTTSLFADVRCRGDENRYYRLLDEHFALAPASLVISAPTAVTIAAVLVVAALARIVVVAVLVLAALARIGIVAVVVAGALALHVAAV
mmetsp:Transcript_5062/g.12360  ORF Transcript_5062/g.12360 Transcript_5062/m.12360 type:complete len:226 (-) Transcript_5062:173-850(-)